MKKLVLLSAILATSMTFAQSNNAEDHAQPRPDSKVKENVLTERQVTQAVVLDGQVITETTQTTVQPSINTVQIEAPVKSLPPAQIVDASKDLEATMKVMGRNFKALRSASALADMAAPAAELSKWASQAEALSVQAASEKDQEKYVQGMQQTRKLAADLEVAIQSNDETTVRSILNDLGDTRKEYHRYFDVN